MIEPNIHTHMHIFMPEQENMQNFQENWIRHFRGLLGTSFVYGNSKSETAVTLSKNMESTIPDHMHIFILKRENLQSFKKIG